MFSPEKPQPENDNQDPLEGLSDEEVLQQLEHESSSCGIGGAKNIESEDFGLQAARIRRGLELIQKAKSADRPNGVAARLKNLFASELAGQGFSGLDAERMAKYYSKGTLIAGDRYRLESMIGEGGMGTVWVAEQREPVRRRVALKLIKPGMDSRQVLQRFESERQALAAMDHPSIARVFDAGLTERDHPYFVMELVNGANLTQFCDEAKLTVRERLEIFCQIANAIQHAHHKGVLHRDLKPSNILVTIIDGKPVPKIIDFGLAKILGAQNESAATGFGMVVGTVEYMAPEQAGYSGQDVDTRADIYSLGVILYELLTGLRPFDSDRIASAAIDEVLRIIKTEEPVRPSIRLSSSIAADSNAGFRRTESAKLSGLLRKELDWVVMKSLEKDRNRRYDSAKVFADDVQRYLSGEPVAAHPPSFSYRMRKFVGKHRLVVFAASVIFLASILGVAGIVAGFIKAKQSERVAIAETKAKEDALEKMQAAQVKHDEARRQALKALRSMTDEFMSTEIARDTDFSRKDRTYLKNIIQQFDAFSDAATEDVEGRTIRADARARVGRIYSFLGDTAVAETHLREALQLWMELVKEYPDEDQYQTKLSTCQQSLGWALMELGQNSEAEKLKLASLNYWRDRAEKNPARNVQLSYANRLIDVARFCAKQLKFNEAEKLYLEAIEIRQEVTRAPETREQLASAMSGLASVYDLTGQSEKAQNIRDKSIELRRRNVRRFSARTDFKEGLAVSLMGNGSSASSRADWIEAEHSYREAQQILQELAGQFPSMTEHRSRIADCLFGLGSSYAEQDRKAESIASFRKEIEVREVLLDEYSERSKSKAGIAALQFSLGRSLERLNEHQQAELNWREAIRIREQLLGEFPDDHANAMELARVYQSLAIMQNEISHEDEATDSIETALKLRREAVEAQPDHTGWRRQLASNLLCMARIISKGTRTIEAKSLAEEGFGLLQELQLEQPEDQQLKTLLTHGTMDLAMIDIELRNFGSAKDWLSKVGQINDLDLRTSPDKEQFRRDKTRLLYFLIQLHAGQLGSEEVLKTAVDLRDLGWNPPKNSYYAACGLARCVRLVSNHSELSEEDRRRQSQEYADQALVFLQRAISLGYGTVELFERDSDLDSLRDRSDFQRIMKSLQAIEGQ